MLVRSPVFSLFTVLIFVCGSWLISGNATAGPAGPDAPVWVSQAITTTTGSFELKWSGPENETVDRYRVQENFSDAERSYFIESAGFALFRSRPGRYRFRVSACASVGSTGPQCGRASKALEVTVSDDILGLNVVTQAAGSSPQWANDAGAAELNPGVWYDPLRSGHGWSFYWANRLALPESDPMYGQGYDLAGYWYTYEAMTKRLTSDPGEPVEVEFDDYAPVWLGAQMVSVGADSYSGQLIRVRRVQNADCPAPAAWSDGFCQENVGSLTVNFDPDRTRASLDWDAHFPNQYLSLSGQNITLILDGSDTSVADNPGHYSGAWRKPPDASGSHNDFTIIDTIRADFESVGALFFDDTGEPVWMSTEKPGLTTANNTEFCFFYVPVGYAPDSIPVAGWQASLVGDGCDPGQPVSSTNRNAGRRFTEPEKAWAWFQLTLPPGMPLGRTGSLNMGSPAATAELVKGTNFHRIWHDLDPGLPCTLTEQSPTCGVDYHWFTDGHYPEASAFLREISSISSQWIRSGTGPVMLNQTEEIESAGTYRLELRQTASPLSSLLGWSQNVEVVDERTPPPPPPPPPPPTPPSTPHSLTADWLDQSSGSWRVSWSPGDGAQADGYQLREVTPSGTNQVESLADTQRDYSRPDSPLGEYRYQVSACNTDGCSDWSAEIVFEFTDGGSGENPNPSNPERPPDPAPSPGFGANVQSSRVGETRGTFEVDASGAARYSIPVLTAPGSGGMAPAVSLDYSSLSDNGSLGVGWSLGGFSVISRCAATIEQDGLAYSTGITLTGSDRFCLDGQRLMLADGVYGEDGAEYRTEIEQFARIRSYGESGTGPAWFRVWKQDGTISDYGNTADSRIQARAGPEPDTAITWLQSNVVDRAGNEITFHYLEHETGPVDFVPDRVRYTGNRRNGTSPWAELRFVWEEGREDQPTAWLAGSSSRNSRLLKRIDSVARLDPGDSEFEFLRSYLPGYGEDGHGRQVMESLQECRDPSRAICFPATQFDWLKSEHALSPVGKTLAGLLPEDMSGLNIADVNGDGKPDLLVTTKQGKNYQLRVSQFNASGGFDPLSWSVELPKASKNSPVTVQVMDINADGYHDLLYPSDTNGIQWVVRLGSEQGLSSESVVGEGALMNPAVVQVMDFDGDGLADLLHNRRNASDTGNELVMLRNIRSPGGTHRLAEPVVIGIDLTGLFPLQTGDGWFLSDEFPNIGVNEDSAVGARVFDYNADGRVDLLLNVNRLYEACDQNCTNPSEVPTDQPDQTGRQFEARFGITALATSRDADNVRKGGGKGGGVETARASFWVLFESDAESGFVQRDVISAGIDCEVAEICLPYAGSGAAVNIRPADLNADGLADVVYHDESGTWFSRTNTGLTFLPAEVIAHTPADLSVFARLEDWNGDGLPDLAYPDSIEASARWLVMFNNQGSTFSAPLEGGVPAGAFLEGDASLFADFSGDGKRDFLFIDRDTYGQLSAVTLHQGINLLTGSKQEEAVNVLQNIRHGLGSRIGINWLPLTNTTVYTRYAQSAVLHWGRGSPVYDLIAPIYVVSQVSQSAPVMGDAEALRSLQYGYFGARIQAGGRGLLGFAEMVTFDPQTAIRTNTRYRQDFPFIGLAVDTTQAVVAVGQGLQALTSAVNDNEIFRGAADLATTPPALSPGESLLAYRYNEWAASPSVGAEKARVISLNGTVEQQFTLAGNLDRKTVSSHRYDSSGNQLESTVSTYDGNQSVAFASRAIHNQWAPDDPLRWLPGRLLSATVTHARAGASSISRSTAYDYDAESGLLVRETTEPLDARFRVVTEYLLDSFGNRIRKTVTGEGMTPRSVSSQWDSLGRWVTRSSNVYGQTTLKVLETDIFGNLLVTEDIDSVVTTIAADAMGRSYGRYTQTGAWSASTQVAGSGSICPQETAYHVVTVTGGAGSRYRCLDSIGREIRNSVPGFSGRRIFSDQYHDINGRQVLQSEPYFSGDTRYWNTMRYDRMGRVLEAQSADGNRVLYAYDESADSQCITGGARSRRSTNALGQVTSENRNPLGETIEVFDQQCGRVGFTHDAVGNLTSTSGVDGETVTVSWDRMGRKTSLSDPDKGLWRYAYNPLGEMTRQLDSKGQAIDFEYDVLGRVTEKRELRDVGSVTDASFTVVNVEITSYENSSSANARGKGRPESISYRTGESGAILHKRDFIYDGFGRPDIVTTTIGNQQFNEQTTYDEYGRVFQQFDASGDDHGLRYVYSSGFLKQLKEARAGVDGVVYQDVMAMDARGNVTAMQLGNNVSVHASHDPVNGRLQRIEAFDNYGVALQEVDYLFDLLGNLKQRHDQSAGNDHKEDFTYDDLNRLQQVQLTAPTLNINSPVTTLSLAYNQSGNISHKSDVGNYLYDGAQPHAVTSAGGVNYSYDANGNQVSGDGRSINYTVYDKPDTISRGQSQVVFSYGIGNSRYQRQDREANVLQKTTLYLGPTERISENGSTFFKRYLGGVAIADYFPESGIQQLNYLLKDHLGSIHTVLDENGLIVARMHFSAFGERQEANWQTPMTSFLYTPLNDLTTRGFTGHEQVDSMGIIHMNGRIYDPRLGRFLQADPVVQAPKNGQSLNRYSYALNNPLSYTDPSGYFSLKRFFKKWGRVIFAAAAAYFTYGAAFTWAANSIASGVANSLTLAKIVGNVGWKVVAGAVAGASSGFVAGAIISRSLRGAVKGALAGAITGGVVGYHGDSYNLGRIASESLGGGVSAKILGGKFEDGLKFALVVSSVTYINYRMDLAERINSAKNSDNLNKPGSRLFGRKYSLAGARRTVSADGSYLPCGSPAGGCQGLPIPGNLDQASNLIGIPYNPEGPLGYIVDTFAGPHDWLRNHISGSYDVLGNSRYLTGIEKLIDEFANAALIPVAAPFSAAALLGTQPALYLTTLENIYGD